VSSSEKFFECFAKTAVFTPETMSPQLALTLGRLSQREAKDDSDLFWPNLNPLNYGVDDLMLGDRIGLSRAVVFLGQ
jgi:hypothetical protein